MHNTIFIIFLVIFSIFGSSLARAGLYASDDPFKSNRASKLDLSVEDKGPINKNYGYKFVNEGVFISPEMDLKIDKTDSKGLKSSSASNPDSSTVNYNIKMNLGYEFNKTFSAFIGRSFLDATHTISGAQVKSSDINDKSYSTVGTQININEGFGVRFSYARQDTDSNDGYKSRNDMLKFSTTYSF